MECLLHGIKQEWNVMDIVIIKRKNLQVLKKQKHMRKINIEGCMGLKIHVMLKKSSGRIIFIRE